MLRYNVVLNENVNKWRINMITVAFLKTQKIEAMRDFMSFMSANYQGRYNGKEVAQLFQKS